VAGFRALVDGVVDGVDPRGSTTYKARTLTFVHWFSVERFPIDRGHRLVSLLTRTGLVLALSFALISANSTPAAASAVVPRDHLYDVCILNGLNSWAVGAFGTIFHSTDGGTTWEAQTSGLTEHLLGVDFADDKHGWAVGRSAVILHTQDGGQTWAAQKTDDKNHLFDVVALSPERAIAIGDWGTVLVTTDGGANWQKRSLDRDVILNAQAWTDAEHGWIVGEAGLVLATTDGGATWTEQNSGTMKTLFGVSFADAQRGWAVGLDGLILHTVNGGLEWQVQRGSADVAALDQVGSKEMAENPTLFDIAMVDSTGYAVGDGGSVFLTGDGGVRWQRATVPAEVRMRWIRAVALSKDRQGLFVGANGLALRLTDARASAETEQHASSTSY